jgi:flavin reductase (DIM6/NTAB) family NADH-FMN oxidoreductase RutF
MKKRSIEARNTVCPQPLFLHGTFREDGKPNFGLFCWVTYCLDGGLGAIVSIGGEKLTKDRIRAKGVLSANLVCEGMLPLADYFGSNSGYEAGKMDVPFAWSRGAVLDVPVLDDSPWSYELEVKRELELDGGTVFVCAIRNVLADETLLAEGMGTAEKIGAANPVLCFPQVYCTTRGGKLGNWGDWKDMRTAKGASGK